jgi:hypothetical protein
MIFTPPARDWWVEVRPVGATWTARQVQTACGILNRAHVDGPFHMRIGDPELDAHRFVLLAEQVGPIRVAARPFDRDDRPWRDDEWVTVGTTEAT